MMIKTNNFLISFLSCVALILSSEFALAYDYACYENDATKDYYSRPVFNNTFLGHFSSPYDASAIINDLRREQGSSGDRKKTRETVCDGNTSYRGTGTAVFYKYMRTGRPNYDSWWETYWTSWNTEYNSNTDTDGDGILDKDDLDSIYESIQGIGITSDNCLINRDQNFFGR